MVQAKGMAEGDQLSCSLGSLDSRKAGCAEHITLGAALGNSRGGFSV
jgi:hypothetical protein